jgi:hypothetical protein
MPAAQELTFELTSKGASYHVKNAGRALRVNVTAIPSSLEAPATRAKLPLDTSSPGKSSAKIGLKAALMGACTLAVLSPLSPRTGAEAIVRSARFDQGASHGELRPIGDRSINPAGRYEQQPRAARAGRAFSD